VQAQYASGQFGAVQRKVSRHSDADSRMREDCMQ
jgi:hypothetical protein